MSSLDVGEPSNKRDVSPAYWESLYSSLSINIPFSFVIIIIIIIIMPKIKAHSRNGYGDIGSLCLQTLSG